MLESRNSAVVVLSGHSFSIYANFSEKRWFLTPRYAHVYTRSKNKKVFRKILRDPYCHISVSPHYNVRIKKMELFTFYLLFTCYLLIIWERVYLQLRIQFSIPNRHLLAQTQQWKHQNNLWNLIKVKNKNTKSTPLTSFWCLYS